MKTYNLKQVRFEASFEQLPDDDSYEMQPRFGLTESNAHSIYAYTDWFYDGDEDAFSVI
jgi:hypothetical protein